MFHYACFYGEADIMTLLNEVTKYANDVGILINTDDDEVDFFCSYTSQLAADSGYVVIDLLVLISLQFLMLACIVDGYRISIAEPEMRYLLIQSSRFKFSTALLSRNWWQPTTKQDDPLPPDDENDQDDPSPPGVENKQDN
uniref:Uncharacterized protein n=1 Tax=Octactis speculum TaxID=3111310 RepID=A0A7S2AMF0_9STRA|mmetsp:Transcript_12515/g.16527  ORF Transcript_12515/g.16527 Transcript_12515/m.16527 type:complete len:141 (+) Transcript_12515:198-620(+)